jgi:hypothetical protein
LTQAHVDLLLFELRLLTLPFEAFEELGQPVEEIATFLCRSRREVREKIAELEQSGELARLVAEAAAGAQDQR